MKNTFKKIENILFWLSLPYALFSFLAAVIDYLLLQFQIDEWDYYRYFAAPYLFIIIMITLFFKVIKKIFEK